MFELIYTLIKITIPLNEASEKHLFYTRETIKIIP